MEIKLPLSKILEDRFYEIESSVRAGQVWAKGEVDYLRSRVWEMNEEIKMITAALNKIKPRSDEEEGR